MKYCPQCNVDYDDETVFCSNDGSRLQVRAPRASAKPQSGGLGRGAGLGGLGPAVLSSQPLTQLGGTALNVPTPPRGSSSVNAPMSAPGGLPSDSAETMRPPSARALAGLALNLPPEPLDRGPTQRAPAISAEMRAVGAPPMDGGPDSDPMVDMPTIAMRTPVAMPTPLAKSSTAANEPELDEDGQRNLIGSTIAGRYKLLRRLGEGGMGVVYEAVDERLEKHVAMKVLRDDFAKRQDVVARFTQEAKSAARIKHENVLDVTDYGQTEDGSFYIAMELLQGTDLADLLQAEGVIPIERGVDIAMQVCRALQAAHGKGIVHRDLKPENVFLVRNDDGRELVKIVDFGIAQMKDISGSTEGSRKLTRTGMIFGTPEYMSPEQAAGKPVDHRVDIYATGVILYEMFAGRVPFLGDTFMGILTKHMFENPPPIAQVNPQAQLPADLEAIIAKALAKDPMQRFASMQEFSDDLSRFRSGARTNALMSPPSAAVVPAAAAQLLGMQSSPGVPVQQPYGQQLQPQGVASVSLTVENELTPAPMRKRRVALIVAALMVLVLVTIGVTLAVVFNEEDPGPNAQLQNDRPGQPLANNSGAPGTQPDAGAAPIVRQGSNGAPTVPVAVNPVVDAGPATPPVARRVRVRIMVEGFPSRTTISFLYAPSVPDRPTIEPCDDAMACHRELLLGVPLSVTAQGRRQQLTATITPTREGEEIRVVAPGARTPPTRPADNANAHPSTQHAPDNNPVPCGRQDPRTGLLRVCFGQQR